MRKRRWITAATVAATAISSVASQPQQRSHSQIANLTNPHSSIRLSDGAFFYCHFREVTLTMIAQASIYPSLVYQKNKPVSGSTPTMVILRVGVATSFSSPINQRANSRKVMRNWLGTSRIHCLTRKMARPDDGDINVKSFSKKESRVESDL